MNDHKPRAPHLGVVRQDGRTARPPARSNDDRARSILDVHRHAVILAARRAAIARQGAGGAEDRAKIRLYTDAMDALEKAIADLDSALALTGVTR